MATDSFQMLDINIMHFALFKELTSGKTASKGTCSVLQTYDSDDRHEAGACVAQNQKVPACVQAVKPVTPKATQAPPGEAESAQNGMWRVLPASAFASRFQHLFKGKGATLLALLIFSQVNAVPCNGLLWALLQFT